MEDRLIDVVQTLYTASLDPTVWPLALTRLADAMGGVDTTLEAHTGPGTKPTFFSCGNRLPDDGVETYLAYYSTVCPRIAMINAQKPGTVGVDYDFITEAEMERDEFYTDFLAPDDLRYFLSACLDNSPGSAVSFAAVHRSPKQGHASGQDAQRLANLIPHVRQALDTHLRLDRATRLEAALLDSLEQVGEGVILLDSQGHAVHANALAEDMLRAGDGLGISAASLLIAEPSARRTFHNLLSGFLDGSMAADLQAGGDVAVPRFSGQAPYLLRVRRLPCPDAVDAAMAGDAGGRIPAVVVFLSDPVREAAIEPERVAAAFGLTQREADLAAALYAGQNLKDHAAARGIRISTARFHLYQAMAKMGVSRQMDMIRLLGRLSLPRD